MSKIPSRGASPTPAGACSPSPCKADASIIPSPSRLQIWSVGLNPDGSFADDARAEFDVKDTPNDNIVTDILFDGPDRLYLSQRGGLTGSYDYSIFAKLEKPVVRRYAWNDSDKQWSEEVGEFAVGLKLPHRSTLGGIALSYGYDADGKIDYGKCRETLWTSGEHLREGEDKERDFKGGARVVHGLQGTDKGNIRPANEPPYQTWFVDNDGQYDDADLYSRIGDIAIYAPCDELTAAAPSPPLSPTPYRHPLTARAYGSTRSARRPRSVASSTASSP